MIETDGSPIDVEELTEFLYHFRAAYAAGVRLEGPTGGHSTEHDAYSFAEKLRKEILGNEWTKIADLAHADLQENQLGIVDIRRDNPLTIVFAGAVVALTAAVILSGGNLQLGPLKVKLPPLGTGIKALREAFGRPQRIPRNTQAKTPRPKP